MANKAFETGDLVWAKMKRYPFWPARIVDPPEHIKSPNSKKGKHCVCFFGTNDFAWIPDDCIVPHTEERVLATKSKPKTSSGLLAAIEAIIEYSNTSLDSESENDSENDASENDASENDASVKDGSEKDASEKDPSEKDASDKDASDKDASESDASENDASEKDASKNISDNDASTELSPSSPLKAEKKMKKRQKIKKELNFDSFSSTESIPSSLEKEIAEASSSENSREILEDKLNDEKETKNKKEFDLLFKSNSNENIAASSEGKNSEDLFPSTSSDDPKPKPKKRNYGSRKKVDLLEYILVPCPENDEEERQREKKRLEKNMKRKIEFPPVEPKTDLGPPSMHFYECPKVPEIVMNKGNYLSAKEIKVIDKKIGFLGINDMSAGILKNLLLSGHNVTIYSENFTLEKYQPYMEVGANVAQTADDVVASCDVTFGYVGDINAVKHLMYANFGILKGLEGCSKGSKGYIEMTPIDVPTALEFQKAFAFYGMKYMIAPIVGSRQIADEGSVLCLAAGDVELFTEYYSCLTAFSRHVYYVHSDLEAGVQMYLIQSMLIGTTTAALAEAIALIKKCNLSFDSFYELIEMGPFSCQLALEKSNLMNSRNFAPNSTLNNQLKDMKLALKLANSNQQTTVITSAAKELYKKAKYLKYSDHDVSSVVMGTGIELEL